LTIVVNDIKKTMDSIGWLVSIRKRPTSEGKADSGAILLKGGFRRDSGFSNKPHKARKFNLMVQKQFMDTEKAGK